MPEKVKFKQKCLIFSQNRMISENARKPVKLEKLPNFFLHARPLPKMQDVHFYGMKKCQMAALTNNFNKPTGSHKG